MANPDALCSSRRRSPRLLDRVRSELRVRHYSLRTEEAYIGWIRRYLRFNKMRHPREMGAEEVNRFLTHLAVARHVSASTQRQALSALLFLYRAVLGTRLPWLDQIVRARQPRRLPTVLSREEVAAVLARLEGSALLVVLLLYGTGLRILECLRLRVKDVDFDLGHLTVRDGKGRKDRATMLPDAVRAPLEEHLLIVRSTHQHDLTDGFGEVWLPDALARKYPGAARQWGWQYVFPAGSRGIDPRSGRERRHHLHETVIRRAIRKATRAAGIVKPVSCHTFRHSFATHLLLAGYDIRTIQDLLGHKDVKTTMIYTHIVNRSGGRGVTSPADSLTRLQESPCAR